MGRPEDSTLLQARVQADTEQTTYFTTPMVQDPLSLSMLTSLQLADSSSFEHVGPVSPPPECTEPVVQEEISPERPPESTSPVQPQISPRLTPRRLPPIQLPPRRTSGTIQHQ